MRGQKMFSILLLIVGLSSQVAQAQHNSRNANLMPDAWFEKIPAPILSGIEAPNKQALVYKKPIGPHPKVFRKVGLSRYQPVQLLGLKLRAGASSQEKYCWDVFVSGGLDCSKLLPTTRPATLDSNADEDLLLNARKLSKTQGMLRAREYLEEAMLRTDSTRGQFERDVIRATRDKAWTAPASVLRLSKAERSRIGIFVIFGIDLSGDSPNRELIRRAAKELETMGFAARLVNTKPAVSYEANARIIGAEFEEMVDKVDHVIFVAASKGVADLLTYMLHDGARASEQRRAKVRGIVSLSGVVRGSNMASWLTHSDLKRLDVVRAVIARRPTQPMEGIESLARDPWQGSRPAQLSEDFPNLKWISVSMLPEGNDGLVPGNGVMLELQQALIRHGQVFSPSDGLVESAATILPPGTGISQRIVRGYGPHALALGHFLNGDALAPQNLTEKGVDPAAGAEILSSFMRALGADLLENR